MVQLYFLSVLINVIGGLVLLSDFLADRISLFESTENLNRIGQTGQKIVGILIFFIGILKLVSVMGDSVPFFGDLLPALANWLIGLSLFFSFFGDNEVKGGRLGGLTLEKFALALTGNRVLFGWITLIIGLLHFMFPDAVLL